MNKLLLTCLFLFSSVLVSCSKETNKTKTPPTDAYSSDYGERNG